MRDSGRESERTLVSPYPGCMDKDKFYKTAFRGTSVERQQKDSSGNEKKTDDLTQPKTVRENSILLIARQGNVCYTLEHGKP